MAQRVESSYVSHSSKRWTEGPLEYLYQSREKAGFFNRALIRVSDEGEGSILALICTSQQNKLHTILVLTIVHRRASY